jgi:cellulose synthase/poly-beta-1,6-N-acetylglucosamine synthase-like glycosyltransferase
LNALQKAWPKREIFHVNFSLTNARTTEPILSDGFFVMSSRVSNSAARAIALRDHPLGHILERDRKVKATDVVKALGEAARLKQPLDQILTLEELANPDEVIKAQALRHGALIMRRPDTPPDARLSRLIPLELCLHHGIYPWIRLGGTLALATSRPDDFEQARAVLPEGLGPIMMVLATEQDIHTEIGLRHGAQLAKEAEAWVPDADSCRNLAQGTPFTRALGICAALCCVTCLLLWPNLLFTLALGLAIVTLIAAQGLKLAALFAAPPPQPQVKAQLPDRPPKVSILVPLLRETELAETLVARLKRLTYPKPLLDVILVLEQSDQQTRRTLAQTDLPPWIRTLAVPPGSVTTKPRALNYAFRFTKGEIIGIYDAEDAPAPDQIDQVVSAFEQAPPDIACLQGILDFYNPKANWLSRCFTIDYASWFRLLLPGLARLGFAVPLGGTTVFFRRSALETVKGWDAHNVTEDADLGMRLGRHGFRTQMIPTVTQEEANNRLWPWVRQRSRWLKGYAVTWWVHSRRPARAIRDLGGGKFFGLQLLFLTALLQALLAPVLWIFWLILIGLPTPVSPETTRYLLPLFLFAEAITLLVGFAALSRSPHRGLMLWVPTMMLYAPLATLAMYKALVELINKPFYWDKTQHGRTSPTGEEQS